MLPAALMLLFTATQQQQLVGWVVKRDPSCIGHVWEAELAFLAGQVTPECTTCLPLLVYCLFSTYFKGCPSTRTCLLSVCPNSIKRLAEWD